MCHPLCNTLIRPPRVPDRPPPHECGFVSSCTRYLSVQAFLRTGRVSAISRSATSSPVLLVLCAHALLLLSPLGDLWVPVSYCNLITE